MHPYKITETASTQAITLDEAKDHLGIASTDSRFDTQITNQIAAATRWCETEAGILIRDSVTFSMQCRAWQREYQIPSVPLQQVLNIFYSEENAVSLQIVDSDLFDVATSDRTRGVLRISDDFEFPTLDPNTAYPVDITYLAGWDTRAIDVPEEAKYACLLILSTLFDHDLDFRQVISYRDRAVDLLRGLNPGVYS